MFGSSRNSVDLAVGEARAHIEPAAAEKEAEAAGGEGTEAAGSVLDGLYFAIEAFGHGVGDGVGKVGGQAAQVIFEHAGDALDRREFAAAGAGIPLVEEGSALVAIPLLPGAGKVFLGQPGSRTFGRALSKSLAQKCSQKPTKGD